MTMVIRMFLTVIFGNQKMQLLQQHTPLHPKLILEVIEIPKMFLFSAKKNTMYNVQMHSLLTLL